MPLWNADCSRVTARFALAAIAASLLLPAAPATAVVVHPNTLLGTPDPDAPPPPGDDPGWGHLGRFSDGSAIYLGTNPGGEHWILTANHLAGPSTFEIDQGSYATDISVSFTNPGGSVADLRAWRLVGGPTLPPLWDIASTTPSMGTDARLLLHGRPEAAFTCWNALWNVIGCGGSPAHRGYPWLVGVVKRWGTNQVSLSGAAIDPLKIQLGINEEIFATDFDDLGTVLETQAASADSGGGLFVWNGSQWELAGITLYIVNPSDVNRPAAVAALDEDSTLYADLAYYRPQILSSTGVVLPEPGVGALAAGVALLAGLARRRSGRR